MNALLYPVLLFAAPPGDAVFGPDRVLAFHLQMDAKQLAAMQPKGGGMFGPPGAARPPADGAHRNTFNTDLPWAQGELTFAEKSFRDVGVRFKGNYTLMASRGLKKSLKIDLDRNVGKQSLDGVKTLNLNCGVADPTMLREALSYALFRAAGVPAPRTSFAELTLTVPGKYDREPVGLFTLVEQVNKPFLARHFKDGSGLLLKPEGLQGGLTHLGEAWPPYEARYRPKNEPTDAQKKRLIDFTRLIDRADDAAFRKQVGSFLDVDAFVRFVAANAVLCNLDSYLGLGHNYYLYLVPGSDRFAFIPWDCDLSLAAWPAAGAPEQQVELSIARPWTGTNRLLERLMAMEDVRAKYRKVVEELTAGPLTKANMLAALEPLEKAVKVPMGRDKKAAADRKEGGGGFAFGPPGGGFGASLPPRAFIERRTESVAAQLAGKKAGYVPPAFGFGPPGGGGGPPRVGDVLPAGVQNQLKLTDEQRRQLAELQKEVDARLEKLLDAEQRAALKRLRDARPGFGPPRP